MTDTSPDATPKYTLDENVMREHLGLPPRRNIMPNYRAEVSSDIWVAPGSIQEPRSPIEAHRAQTEPSTD
jgi:hypothetical protein